MLHYNTIEKPTLELLKMLQQTPVFNDLRLVGGTSLALQIGHRISVDLDLFGSLEADEIAITYALRKYKETTQLKNTQNIRVYLINGIKVDLVNYPYPWLNDVVVVDQLKLATVHDIAYTEIEVRYKK